MKKTLVLVYFSLSAQFAFSQMKNIIIDSVVSRFGPNEPCISISPANPLNMVAGSNVSNVYSSLDGGLTWRLDTLRSNYGVYGDPVIIADNSGAFYYFHLAKNDSITTWPVWADRMVCQRIDTLSTHNWTNGGFSGFAEEPKIEDKPWAFVDNNSNTIYLTWTRFDRYASAAPTDSSSIFFSKSTDKGSTWSPAIRLNKNAGDCLDESKTAEGATPCIGPAGQIFVTWARNDSIVFNRSYDGGNSWLAKETVVTQTPGGWSYNIPGINRCNGLPFAACDISNGPYKGTIYVNWSDQRNGINNTDVWICKSTDEGNTWSNPIKVNDDTGAKQQFFSSMTVDPITGYVYVLFYDRRNYDENAIYYGVFHDATDVYIAISKDGGNSFQNYLVSDAPFFPNSAIFFGDYTYIAAYNNIVRPIWGCLWSSDGTIGLQEIRTAIVDSNILKVPNGMEEKIIPTLSAYPNPFSTKCHINFEMPHEDYVTITITDRTGRLLRTIKNNELVLPGKYSEKLSAIDLNQQPGIYFINLKASQCNMTLKLVLLN